MTLNQRFTRWLLNEAIASDAGTVVDVLRREHSDRVVRKLNHSSMFTLGKCTLPSQVEGFEDLYSLFWTCPLNRGVIRQDFDEAAALFKLVRSLGDPVGVEIGRRHGGSTILLAAAVGPRGRVTSIDVRPQDDGAVQQALSHGGLSDRVKLIVADANTVELSEEIDFAFIDGDHSYAGAKRDHNAWGPKVRPGGYLIYHDMASSRKMATQISDLMKLRSEILAQASACLELLQEVGSMSMWQRTEAPWQPL